MWIFSSSTPERENHRNNIGIANLRKVQVKSVRLLYVFFIIETVAYSHIPYKWKALMGAAPREEL